MRGRRLTLCQAELDKQPPDGRFCNILAIRRAVIQPDMQCPRCRWQLADILCKLKRNLSLVLHYLANRGYRMTVKE